MPLEKSAGAVIFRKEDNKPLFLLLRYPSSGKAPRNYWDLPKGHIEKGEKELDTVKREVEEETGLKDLKFIEGFKEWIKYFFFSAAEPPKELARPSSAEAEPTTVGEGRRDTSPRQTWRSSSAFAGKKIFKIVTFYLAETQNAEVKISSEHIGYEWLPYEKAVKKLTFKNAKEIVRKANEYLEKQRNI